ncbi:CDP-glycerol glycerophosphotransferase family protein [Halomarina ordinaria]|uniref:CDP-glycerol glycerophosphotransferase family protein n=1 Tax=Halomarina ordinaria TaxID=3033939 RepID=A0ABD5U9R3_9EURY|nr:CDP-glycerol glycerophosphotransferase family protein [Halomarina sp. PSRA2]
MPTDAAAVRAALDRLLTLALYALSFLVPRDERLWAFGCSGGTRFAENSKYLFLHLANGDSDVRPVWMTRRDDLLADLRAAGYEAYHRDSLRGRLTTLRAGHVFFTHSLNDVGMEAALGSEPVNLWHGVPLKRISLDDSYYRHRMGLANLIRTLLIYRTYRYVVVTSAALRSRFATAFNVDEERILPLGYPRNDALFGPVEGETIGFDADALADVEALAADRDVVLYAPTWRESGRGVVEHLDLARLDEWAREHDATVLLKLHPNAAVEVGEEYEHVVHLPAELDVHPAMRHADVLVTDYSSLYFDFLLLDRPLVFFPFDLERYLAEDRELYFDYDDTTPGPKATDTESLCAELTEALEDDGYAEERARVRERFFDHVDGESSRRVSERLLADVEAKEAAE